MTSPILHLTPAFSAMPTSIRNQSCPNGKCEFFGKSLAGNVVVHSSKNMRFKCKICGRTWVMYRNEVRYGLRTDLKKFESARQMLGRGGSVRIVAREVEVSPSTVQRWKRRLNESNYLLTLKI